MYPVFKTPEKLESARREATSYEQRAALDYLAQCPQKNRFSLHSFGRCNGYFPREGEYFVLSPRQKLYFYGRVEHADIKGVDTKAYDGLNSIIIFRAPGLNESTANLTINDRTLLVPPLLLPNECTA